MDICMGKSNSYFLSKWASIEEAFWIKNYKYQENIRMTHDLDAIQLTLPMSIKTNIFKFI